MRGRDPSRDFREQADTIQGTHLDLRIELAFHAFRPIYGNPLRRVLAVLGEISAVVAMNHYAAAARHEADDLVARNRVAAARVIDDHTFRPCDLERLARVRVGLGLVRSLREHSRDDRCQPLAEADLLVEHFDVADAELGAQRLEPGLWQLAEARRVRHELLVQEPSTELLRLVPLEILE